MKISKSKNKYQILPTFPSSSLSRSRGFTLLFASLIGALVLAVGMAILGITIKQLSLSAAGKATQQSFYSADAGVECALYLDRGADVTDCRLGFFPAPTTTMSYTHPGAWSCVDTDPNFLSHARCMGKSLSEDIGTNVTVDNVTGDVTTVFSLSTATAGSDDDARNDDMCFIVAVTKKALDGSTIIESRGYNTCNEDATNRFERAIRSVNQ